MIKGVDFSILLGGIMGCVKGEWYFLYSVQPSGIFFLSRNARQMGGPLRKSSIQSSVVFNLY